MFSYESNTTPDLIINMFINIGEINHTSITDVQKIQKKFVINIDFVRFLYSNSVYLAHWELFKNLIRVPYFNIFQILSELYMMIDILNKETKLPKYIKRIISTVMLSILFLISVVMINPDDPKTIKLCETTVNKTAVK